MKTNQKKSAPAKPINLKKILVPVDFSKCSQKAVTYAVAFARQFKASITLLYVLQPYLLPGDYAGGVDYALMEKEIETNSKRELQTMLEKLIAKDVPAKARLELGRPVDQICRVAKDQNFDLIVISTHGHTGLKHVVLGSTAENVVRHAPCPVLTVRVEEHEFVNG